MEQPEKEMDETNLVGEVQQIPSSGRNNELKMTGAFQPSEENTSHKKKQSRGEIAIEVIPFEGLWRHVLLVAVDVDGTFILHELPNWHMSSPPVPCGDSTAALLSACRSREGVDSAWFDRTTAEAVKAYVDGYNAIFEQHERERNAGEKPEERMKQLLAEVDKYEEQVASTPLTKSLILGISTKEIDKFMNTPLSPMQLPHPGAPETVLALIGKGVPVAFTSLAWSTRIIFQALRQILRKALRKDAPHSPPSFPLVPEAYETATNILQSAAASSSSSSSSSTSSSSLAFRTLAALAADGEELPADTPLLAVDANEIEVDANGTATGELLRKVVAFSDKGRVLSKRQQWAASIREEQERRQRGSSTTHEAAAAAAAVGAGVDSRDDPSQQKRPGKDEQNANLTVFIGDSDGDIAGFLKADLAIFIGNPARCRFEQMNYLRFCPLKRLREWLQRGGPAMSGSVLPAHSLCDGKDAIREVFHAESWAAIYALFFGFWPAQSSQAKESPQGQH